MVNRQITAITAQNTCPCPGDRSGKKPPISPIIKTAPTVPATIARCQDKRISRCASSAWSRCGSSNCSSKLALKPARLNCNNNPAGCKLVFSVTFATSPTASLKCISVLTSSSKVTRMSLCGASNCSVSVSSGSRVSVKLAA